MKKNAHDQKTAGTLKDSSLDSNPQMSLFGDDCQPFPHQVMPSAGTVAHRLLMLLLTGATVTQQQWLDMGNGWRLAADVQTLKYLGWEIESIKVPTATRPISRYNLSNSALRQAFANSTMKGACHVR